MPLTTLHALLLDASDAGLARLAAAHGSGPEVRTAWAQLRGDVSLASAAIAAIERSGALTEPLEPRPRMLVEDLLSLLGKVSHGHDLLLRAWREAPQHEVRQRAGLALLARRQARGLEALAARLDEATGNERVLALQAVFTRDPGEAHAVLSPRFTPPSPRAAGFVYDSLHVLMRDIHDDGRAHWGATRGWFAADPRWMALCEAWTKLPDDRAAWGEREAQGIVEVAGWLRKRK